MSRKKSIALICVVAVLILFLAFVTFVPLNHGELGTTNFNSVLGNLNLGTDLNGGVYANYSAKLKDGAEEDYDAAYKKTTDLFNEIISAYGFSSINFSKTNGLNKEKGFRVDVNATSDYIEIIDLFGKSSTAEFCSPSSQDSDGNYVKGTVLFNGAHIASSSVMQYNGKYYVVINFDEEGTKLFADATSTYSAVAIWINGERIVEPSISEQITSGTVQIGGNYTREQALLFASRLRISTLNMEVGINDYGITSPTLGQNTALYIMLAVAALMVLALIVLAIRYRLLGLVADISLIACVLLTVLFVAALSITVTFIGVLAFILCFAVAVLFNVIILERIRFEYSISPSDSLPSAFKAGVTKSLWVILDSMIITLIASGFLFLLGITDIKSIGAIIFVGVALAGIAALLLTRVLLNAFLALNSTKAKAYALAKKTDVDGGNK